MMRAPTIKLRVVFVAGAIAMVACGEPAVSGCAVTEQGGDRTGLTYQGYIPGECPVEVAVPASTQDEVLPNSKRVGANLHATANFSRAVLQVFNSLNRDVLSRSNLALYDVSFLYNRITGRLEATLDANYDAATGWNRDFTSDGKLGSSANDDAIYTAYRTDDRTSPQAKVTINYKPSTIRASISGPEIPIANSLASWSGAAQGGTLPYSFRWYRNGELVGTGSTYSASNFSSEFGLRLETTDQYNVIRNTDYWVDVDGVRATLAGPDVVYSSEGGGTWTASGAGGYPPYSFEWNILDPQGRSFVSTGDTYSGYPGEGESTLRLRMTDSRGRTHERAKMIRGIGDPDGCQPVPPQVTCSP